MGGKLKNNHPLKKMDTHPNNKRKNDICLHSSSPFLLPHSIHERLRTVRADSVCLSQTNKKRKTKNKQKRTPLRIPLSTLPTKRVPRPFFPSLLSSGQAFSGFLFFFALSLKYPLVFLLSVVFFLICLTYSPPSVYKWAAGDVESTTHHRKKEKNNPPSLRRIDSAFFFFVVTRERTNGINAPIGNLFIIATIECT